jgi:hypothetical protein
LIEYPNTASTRALIRVPSELEEQASTTTPRPLIEHSNNALSIGLEEPEVRPVTLPRPLIEYANSGATFALEPLTGVDLSQVQPRPLVEYADGGWALTLSAPTELLQRKYAVPPSGFGRSQGDSVAAEWVFLLCEPLPSSSLQKILMW